MTFNYFWTWTPQTEFEPSQFSSWEVGTCTSHLQRGEKQFSQQQCSVLICINKKDKNINWFYFFLQKIPPTTPVLLESFKLNIQRRIEVLAPRATGRHCLKGSQEEKTVRNSWQGPVQCWMGSLHRCGLFYRRRSIVNGQ